MSKLISAPIAGPARLRALLASGQLVVAPGCHDALSARLVEEAGFEAAYMTGFGVAAALLGRPDVGLTTLTEMVESARRITAAIDLPLIADADTGFGNAVNVVRTVQLYEQAGVAAIQLEDQVMPKKCGHMEGKQVVDMAEAVGKVSAAVAARSNADLIIIARTDARAVEGLDAAIERALRFADAGADVLFVEAMQDEDEVEQVAEALRGHRLLFNWAEGGKTPPLSAERIAQLGFSIVICPLSGLLSATTAMRRAYAAIRQAGTPQPLMGELPAFGEFTSFIGLGEIVELEGRFSGGSR